MGKMMEYERTHPWLTFMADLAKASPELWLLLGECQSKCEHLAKYPLRPDVAKRIHQMYLIKGALGSAAIEGNTLSEDEVKRILDGELTLPPSQQYLGQEVDNIINECNSTLERLGWNELLPVSVDRLKDVNRAVLKDLKLEPHVLPGAVRSYPITVGPYRGAPHAECEALLIKLCQWLNDKDQFGSVEQPRAMVYAILKAIIAHLYFVWIHPFGDGNGRTARLIEFQILISSRVPSPAAHLLSNHYSLTRSEYYRQLHYASKSGGDILPFMAYAVQGFVDGLKSQLEVVKKQVLDVVWQNYVSDAFMDSTSPADIRRRDLVEDLSRIDEPTALPYDQLPFVSPRVQQHYAKRTSKTLVRDIEKLIDMRLLTTEKGLIRARKEEILSFLPASSPIPLLDQKPQRARRGRPR